MAISPIGQDINLIITDGALAYTGIFPKSTPQIFKYRVGMTSNLGARKRKCVGPRSIILTHHGGNGGVCHKPSA